MKNKISMFLLLILLLHLLTKTGYAAEKINISQLREQIPERWMQDYQAHGRTISVDVSPIVPKVDAVPIFKVVKDISKPDVSDLGNEWTSKVFDDGLFHIEIGYPFAEDSKTERKIKPALYYPPFDFEKSYAQNNPLTLGEVIRHLETIMNDVDHGQWSFKKPFFLSTEVMDENEAKRLRYQGDYAIEFLQELGGIPIFEHALLSVDEPKGDPPSISTQLICKVRTLSDLILAGNKVEVVETLTDDVPLCDFSEIQKSIEKEIMAGHIRRIFDVEFGYVLYNQPGATIRDQRENNLAYYAVPMWVVNCYYVPSPRTELRDYSKWDVPERGIIEYKQLFINAQTGEVIDRKANHKGAVDYTGFLSWEDVGGKP